MRVKQESKLKEISDFIIRFVEENNGVSPSLSDIMRYTGMGKSTAYRYILELRSRGIVKYSGKNTLQIEGQNEKKILFSKVAILGTIPCGSPVDYKQEIQKYVAIPNEWVDGECYLLRSSGDSMVDIGIEDGDLVLIKIESYAKTGQVVAVLTEEGTTLKRYMVDTKGRPWLLSENSSYTLDKKKLYPNEIKILGVALKVIKDIR